MGSSTWQHHRRALDRAGPQAGRRVLCLTQSERRDGGVLQSTASASRSTWSGSVLHGKRISSSQPTCVEAVDVRADGVLVDGRARGDGLRVLAEERVVVAEVGVRGLAALVAEGEVRRARPSAARRRGRRAPGRLEPSPCPPAKRVRRAAAHDPAVAVLGGALEDGVGAAADQQPGRPPGGLGPIRVAAPRPRPSRSSMRRSPCRGGGSRRPRPRSRPRGRRRRCPA